MTQADIRKRARQVLKNYRRSVRTGQTEEIEAIEQALSYLKDEYKNILESRYINRNTETLEYISLRKGYSLKTIQSWSNNATIEFAEAYKNGVLLKE